MTEERLARNKQNSDKLNNIIVWSIQNYDLWLTICFDGEEHGINTNQLSYFIDQCLHMGFMEIYYMILTKIADTVEIGGDLEQLVNFLEICTDKNLSLDMERIRNTIKLIK